MLLSVKQSFRRRLRPGLILKDHIQFFSGVFETHRFLAFLATVQVFSLRCVFFQDPSRDTTPDEKERVSFGVDKQLFLCRVGSMQCSLWLLWGLYVFDHVKAATSLRLLEILAVLWWFRGVGPTVSRQFYLLLAFFTVSADNKKRSFSNFSGSLARV